MFLLVFGGVGGMRMTAAQPIIEVTGENKNWGITGERVVTAYFTIFQCYLKLVVPLANNTPIYRHVTNSNKLKQWDGRQKIV